MCAVVQYRFFLERQCGSEWVEVGQYSCEAYAEEALSEMMVADRVRVCRYESQLARKWGDEFYVMSPALYGRRYRIRPLEAWVPDSETPSGGDVECLDEYEYDDSPLWLAVLRVLFRLVGVRV